MPGIEWENELGPNMEEYKNYSSLKKDITHVVLQKAERLSDSAANHYMKLQLGIEFKWDSEGQWIIPTFCLEPAYVLISPVFG